MMPPALLEAHEITAGYGDAVVLRHLSLRIMPGVITAIVGSNGAGKTTLMRVFAGLVQPDQGAVLWGGRDITTASTSARVAHGIALVPEGRLVFPDFTVEETLKIGAFTKRARGGARGKMAEVYDLFPRLAQRRAQRAGSLSGGEQQMLALGRGLMSAPTLLLLDEPSLGLAPMMAAQLFRSIIEICRTGVTVCLVEQDVRNALAIAHQGYVIENGAVVASGTGAALVHDATIKESILGL